MQLEAGDDLVQRRGHENDPIMAVIELVQDSLDADAHDVQSVIPRMQPGS
ncbi:hypothetical protein [Georgenia yuyongxinii]